MHSDRTWSRQVRYEALGPDPAACGAFFRNEAAQGFAMLEIRGPHDLSPAQFAFASKIRETACECGMGLAWHAPQRAGWDFSKLPVPEAVAKLRVCIRFAACLGARCLTLHPSDSIQPSERWALLRKSADTLAAAAAEADRHDVLLCAECQAPANGREYLLSSVAEFDELFALASSPHVRFTLDTGHANAGGYMYELLARHGAERLGFVHLNDNNGIDDEHLPPGRGTIDWPRLLHALHTCGYAGALNFELKQAFDSPAHYRAARTHIERILAHAGDPAILIMAAPR
ncbi:MAG: sugar phosphate isomerase/epimerase [Kiritimatiellae bacterium]|nr:sugar phosphate isomerase/epimerase [Kiritimatiellia bacterium]